MNKIGTENYKVDNHPFYVPKENMKFLMAMEKLKEKREVSTINPGSIYSSKNNKK